MSSATEAPLRAVLVGCGGMGGNQARILNRLKEFELVAVCDLDAEAAGRVAGENDVKPYADFGEMLEAERPDTVSVTTSNTSHAALTIQAAEFGVLGVYCEKPMATNLKDARAMVAACRDRGIPLVINHQRRLGADLVEARRLIEAGAIGEIERARGNCGGDLLSDGTHLIDSLMWMLGDPQPKWAFGQIHREINDFMRQRAEQQGRRWEPGFRYGHHVENGVAGMFETETGVRVELLTGDMREEGRHYQDYEVFGTEGRLWRTNARFRPNLFIHDAQGGTWHAGLENHWLKPVPSEDGSPGLWRPVEVEWDRQRSGIAGGYRLFARAVHERIEHPMRAELALRGFEALIGIYESARTHRRVQLPGAQPAFPLELMVEAGVV